MTILALVVIVGWIVVFFEILGSPTRKCSTVPSLVIFLGSIALAVAELVVS